MFQNQADNMILSFATRQASPPPPPPPHVFSDVSTSTNADQEFPEFCIWRGFDIVFGLFCGFDIYPIPQIKIFFCPFKLK